MPHWPGASGPRSGGTVSGVQLGLVYFKHLPVPLAVSEPTQMVSLMSSAEPRFMEAFPYQSSVLALPVTDIDAAARWYSRCFGMVEVERRSAPAPTVVLERDGMRIGFSVNGGDPSQDGAAILVSGIAAIRSQLEASGVNVSEWRMDERGGRQLRVFFVVAPDGLCYYFHEPV
jgi:hypothetical protein